MKRTALLASLFLVGCLAGCGHSNEIPVYKIEEPQYNNGDLTLNASSDATVALASDKHVFSLEKTENGHLCFTNRSGGYKVLVPQDFDVIDMGDATYRSTLANADTRLEIYTQALDPATLSAASYLNYSNRFLENTRDFQVVLDETTTVNDCQVHILAWDRRVLSGIPNDRNHFAIIDTANDTRAVTMQFSSTKPFDAKTLHAYADSLVLTKPKNNAKDYPRFVKARTNLNAETKAFYDKTFSEEAPFTWGIFEATYLNGKLEKLPKIEKALDYQFDIFLNYTELHEVYPEDYIKRTLNINAAEGAVTELTLQTPRYDPINERNALFDVLDGKYDAFLHAYAKDVAAFQHPVLFRPFNEMNGDWCTYCAMWAGRDCNIYVELYRYIYRIFEEEGANANTLWIWNPNERSFPDFGWNAIDNYYPGDEYVDIVGLTGYNTGNYYEGEIWRTFDEIYQPIYAKMAPQYHQPMMITEFSCATAGGDKAEWVRDMFKKLPNYPRIKAAVWWNGADRDVDGTIARSYYIDDNEEAFAVFKEQLPREQKQ